MRDDLITRRYRASGGGYIVIKDPESGEFFRFGEVEHFITEQLDGETSLDQIRRRTQNKFGRSLRRDTLQAFLETLQKHRLLVTDGPGKRGQSGRRVRGSILYLRVPLVNPAAVLDRLVKPTRWMFTPHFVVMANALIVVGAMLLVGQWDTFVREVPTLYRWSSIPLLMGGLFVLVVGHELGHALTCRHFGGEVREMGFLFIYFQPALYCNVSDAWLFPQRRQRLWVGFAGPYIELFLWSVAMIVWWATAAGTTLHHLALIAVAGSGLKTLVNFNPLIKWDGYYLLSDYLELPNLRKKSFLYVGEWLRTIFGVIDGPSPGPTARERRVYLGYGLLATVYSFSFLALIAISWGGYLMEQHQPILFAAVMGLVGSRFRRRVRGIMGRPKGNGQLPAPVPSGGGRLIDWLMGPPAAGRAVVPRPAPAPVPAGDRKPDASEDREARRARRARRRRNRRRAWLAVGVALLAWMFLGRMQLRVSGPVTVLPSESADVRAAVEGIVHDIYVDEGDVVKAGQVIARLSADALVAELQATEQSMQEARAHLDKAVEGPRAAEIAVARAAVNTAQGRYEYARARLADIKLLFDQGAATRPEYQEAGELATTAQNELAEARSRLNVLLVGSRPEDIAAARAQLAQLESRRAHLQDQVRKLEVVSPVAGVVATPSPELRAMERQLVTRGALIAKVYDFRAVTAQIHIPEREMADVRVGQPVELRARAFPSRSFRGTVTSIATAAEVPASEAPAGATAAMPVVTTGKTFVVTTRIENDSLLLKPGMTGQAKVYGGSRQIISLIMRRLARTFKVEVWSWW